MGPGGFFAIAMIAATAAASTAAAAESSRPLAVCTTEWPPFTLNTGAPEPEGVHTAVVREAFRRLGFAIAIDNVAWDRCWNEVATGGYDAVYSASYRPERAAVAVYPRVPLQTLVYVAVVLAGTPQEWDGRNLRRLPLPVGAPRGYSVTRELAGRLGDDLDDGALIDLQNFHKLLSGRIGTAVVERTVARYLIDQLGLAGRVEILEPPVTGRRSYYVVIGKRFGGGEAQAQALADRLDGVLADIAREGLVLRLLAEAGLAPPLGSEP